jgi:Uma2 family endonuclease
MIGRVAMFRQACTQLVWIVDPAGHNVTAFSQLSTHWTVGVCETLEGGDIIPGFSVPVAEFFE